MISYICLNQLKQKEMKIINTSISCAMGTSGDWVNVPGITPEKAAALNEIGYTGKLSGKKMSLFEYLDQISTEQCNYSIMRTGGNSMEFTDKYTVTTVIIEPPAKDESNLEQRIYDLIMGNIYLRDVPYSMEEGAQEVDPDSAMDAAKAILKMLKQ
jgi:hypothetical protein